MYILPDITQLCCTFAFVLPRCFFVNYRCVLGDRMLIIKEHCMIEIPWFLYYLPTAMHVDGPQSSTNMAAQVALPTSLSILGSVNLRKPFRRTCEFWENADPKLGEVSSLLMSYNITFF